MRKRIFKYYFILIMAVLILTAIFTSEVAQRYYKYEVENKLEIVGLSIVKHIVNLYNGDIRVKTEVNKGTEFIIQIPY